MENLQKEVDDKANEYLTDEETVYSFDDQEIRTTEPAPFGCDYEIDLDHEVFLCTLRHFFQTLLPVDFEIEISENLCFLSSPCLRKRNSSK